jgi:hypothetical protein
MVHRGRRIVLSRTDHLLHIAKMINQVYARVSNSDKDLTKSDELAACSPTPALPYPIGLALLY